MAMFQSSNVENLSPQVIRQLAKEIGDLTKDPPEGIKIIPNEEDMTDIQATIEGPAGTPYAGGLFRMKLVLGKNFPSDPPKGYFLTKIFHPNVATNGEICVNTLKKDWKAELGIKHVLLVTEARQNDEGETEYCSLFMRKKDKEGNIFGFPERTDQSGITSDQIVEKLPTSGMHGRGLFKFLKSLASATD